MTDQPKHRERPRLPVTTYHLSALQVAGLYRPRRELLRDQTAIGLAEAITGAARFAHLRWLQHLSGAARA